MRRVYDNPKSFGETYGEHREALELSDEELSTVLENNYQWSRLFCGH